MDTNRCGTGEGPCCTPSRSSPTFDAAPNTASGDLTAGEVSRYFRAQGLGRQAGRLGYGGDVRVG